MRSRSSQGQHHIWSRVEGDLPWQMSLRDRATLVLVTQTINTLKREIPNFHMDGSSWTNNLSWVQGYENVLPPTDPT
ncbi:MAG: hypothetical protein HC832_08090 [Leptolyngbyaceae cyanobacterium RM1_405_57]|nr:hypothetical protein [Leptolyngbyaceae cyanobacterium RM1_405_57]